VVGTNGEFQGTGGTQAEIDTLEAAGMPLTVSVQGAILEYLGTAGDDAAPGQPVAWYGRRHAAACTQLLKIAQEIKCLSPPLCSAGDDAAPGQPVAWYGRRHAAACTQLLKIAQEIKCLSPPFLGQLEFSGLLSVPWANKESVPAIVGRGPGSILDSIVLPPWAA